MREQATTYRCAFFEKGLIESLMRDNHGQSGALPLLSDVLLLQLEPAVQQLALSVMLNPLAPSAMMSLFVNQGSIRQAVPPDA